MFGRDINHPASSVVCFQANSDVFAADRLDDALSAQITKMHIASGSNTGHMIASIDLRSRRTTAWAILPTLLFHEMVEFRCTVARMRNAVQLNRS